jgi:uncharacterized protein
VKREVIHLELHTADGSEAASFLSCLLGWRPEEVQAADVSYVSLRMGDRLGGGIVQCGARPAQWIPYVVVDHLESATGRAQELGAAVLLEPREGPYGWRSVVDSPSGGMIALWQQKKVREC